MSDIGCSPQGGPLLQPAASMNGIKIVLAVADLLRLTMEVPAGRRKLAQPPVCTRLGKILTASLDNGTQVHASVQHMVQRQSMHLSCM